MSAQPGGGSRVNLADGPELWLVTGFTAVSHRLRQLYVAAQGGLAAVPDPGKTVIHFSTAPSIHSCMAADQPIYQKHPQPYTQDASLASPGAGVIGACSHVGPGFYATVTRLLRLPSNLTRLTTPSLIHLRPEPFGAYHLEQAAQVADPVDLTWT